jgi:hypothetical protein
LHGIFAGVWRCDVGVVQGRVKSSQSHEARRVWRQGTCLKSQSSEALLEIMCIEQVFFLVGVRGNRELKIGIKTFLLSQRRWKIAEIHIKDSQVIDMCVVISC